MSSGGMSTQGQGPGQATGQAMSQAPGQMGTPTPLSNYASFGRGLGNTIRGINENAMSLFRPRPPATTQPAPPPTYAMPNQTTIPGEVPRIVEDAYNRILGRPSDAPGAAYWQDQMANQGLTGQQLVSGFVNSPEFQRQQQYEQAYTQQFRPGPTGRPFNPNPTPAPTTGPQGQALITRDGQQGYFRQATADEIRRSSQALPWMYGGAASQTPVEGYDARTRQVFVPYSPQATQTTQQQQFFQPIYLSRYQNYQPEGFQGPFGGQMNPYGGFNPFMGFGGMGGMYGFAKGGKVVHKESNQESGIAGLLK